MHHTTEFFLLLAAHGNTIRASVLNESKNIYWSFTDILLHSLFFLTSYFFLVSLCLFLGCLTKSSHSARDYVWVYVLFLMFWQENNPKMPSLKASG